ncbi:hypothetical protein PGT21_032740 [Puccinia graminis f. sp. tritici]|uniref:Uncharacterized protein n=1 Tax=Puccinia graminis f. sp. tritici TaxID=56615 RepID=A0A5B0PMK6_PUCGR|nr:hypothetical protein PGT21_032659 [Puccinia graminis f. sp. tritici]KAA1101910.1 hypothetical protein PGT21_032740 [Puccinia graminis f. sp. tritici]
MMMMMMMIEDEFRLLVGLVEPFEDLDLQQSEQARLLQALKKLRRRSTRNNRALISLTPHPADSIDRSKIIRNRVRWHLRTEQLPLLRDQLRRLSLALDPSCLPEQPNPQFREALKVLSEMDESVDQIKASADSVWESHTPTQDSDPENIEDLTVHRCLLVVSHCKSVLIELSRTIESYERFFSVLVLSDGTISEADQPVDYLQEFRKESIPRAIERELEWIGNLIGWLALSNLAVLEDEWRSMVSTIDETLADLLDFSNASSINEDPEKATIKRQIEAFIPLVKLSRVLLNKLCRSTNSPPRLTSGISLELLDRLRLATGAIPIDLNDIVNTFDTPRPHQITLSSATDSLIDAFRRIKSIFNHHFDSSLQSHPDSKHLSAARRWSELWLAEFDCATTSFLRISHNHIRDDIANDSEP